MQKSDPKGPRVAMAPGCPRVACDRMSWLRRIGSALILAAAACGAAAVPTIQIADAWIRWLPGNLPAGGYLTVSNSGDRPVTLTGATSEDYASVTLHRSRQQGGVASMIPVSVLIIEAHTKRVFELEGLHFMLQQPKKPLKPGDHVILSLQFAAGPPVPVQFELRAPGAS